MKVLNVRHFAGILVVLLAACGGIENDSPSGALTTVKSSSTTVETMPSTTVVAPSTTEEAPPSTSAWSDALMVRAFGSVEGAPLGYLEYLPPGYGEGAPRPLLIFLHGGGEAGDGSAAALILVAKLGIPQLIAAEEWPDDHPFVVLSPQYGLEAAAGPCDVASEVASFLDFAIGNYQVDADRVYLTGISCGAIGVWDYLAAHGDEVVAATVPISGHAEWALESAGCEPLGDVPVWAFHGVLDEIVPTIHIQGPMDKIRACDESGPIEMKLTVYPDADHDAWSRTYDLSAGHDIYAWMLTHTRD
jgi:predicted peptidase